MKKVEQIILVDGDNISPSQLTHVLTHIRQEGFTTVDIFCNKQSLHRWISRKEFQDANYKVCEVVPQAADLKLKSKIIEIYTHCMLFSATKPKIFIAVNDTTFLSDINNLAHNFDVTVISSTSVLLDLQGIDSISLQKEINCNQTLSVEQQIHQLLCQPTDLAVLGNLLISHGITYQPPLSLFIQQLGFSIKANKVLPKSAH